METTTNKNLRADAPTVNQVPGSGSVPEAISPTSATLSDVLTPRLGRPRNGRRSRPDYVQVTAYIPKHVHAGIMMRLTTDRYQDKKTLDFSGLVDELLTNWLSKQQGA
jgi:hypothetical protein